MRTRTWTVSFMMMALGLSGWLDGCARAAEPSYAPDPFVGLYAGTLTDDAGGTVPARAFVYAQGAWLSRGRDVYYARLERKAGEKNWEAVRTVTLTKTEMATKLGERLVFPGDAGNVNFGMLVCRDGQGGRYELNRTEIPSPTLGEKPPKGATVLLPYEPGKPPSLEAWDNPAWRALDDGGMVAGKGDIRTREAFAGIERLHIEFMLPVEPGARGQNRGNSGIYIHDRYEVQVLDSFGLAPGKNTCGAIYGVYAPVVNAARPAGQWQAFDIALNATKGVVLIEVELNGVEIQPWRELTGPTGGGAKDVAPGGPLRLQDHGHPVRYRNIWLTGKVSNEDR